MTEGQPIDIRETIKAALVEDENGDDKNSELEMGASPSGSVSEAVNALPSLPKAERFEPAYKQLEPVYEKGSTPVQPLNGQELAGTFQKPIDQFPAYKSYKTEE